MLIKIKIMGILNGIGSFLGGILGLGGDNSQAETNIQLQKQIDDDNKRDKTQGIIGLLALGFSLIAIFVAFRKS